MQQNELYHFGVKGMKWGVRKKTSSVNKNYTAKQRKQDRAFYGKGGEKRINKKLNEGHGLRGARHYEAERKERNEKIQKKVKKVSQKTARAAVKVGTAYLADQIFWGGAGTKAVKSAVKHTGRAFVSAWVLANGGSNIRWYDNGILD